MNNEFERFLKPYCTAKGVSTVTSIDNAIEIKSIIFGPIL